MKDSKLEKPTLIEKIVGNHGTSIVATLLSAFSGNPFASLLPFLTQTLAGERHKKRVENAIADISKVLETHSDRLREISDEQYKIMGVSASLK